MSNKSERYTEDFKNTIVELYKSSKSLSKLNSKHGASKSTIKSWVKKSTPIQIDNNKTITTADYQVLMKKMARLEKENEILKKAMAIFSKKNW
ncbi:transposase [Clostridium kluyveri]|uniref:Transposase n=1 Tax=Clostridium kluyveri TaxID=1534 RepID=A0A1L5FA75_CLOKL|nr:transposase [Clostridium kluyveri]